MLIYLARSSAGSTWKKPMKVVQNNLTFTVTNFPVPVSTFGHTGSGQRDNACLSGVPTLVGVRLTSLPQGR